MKKLILTSLFFLALIFYPGSSLADQVTTPSPTPEKVNYELPYPGILPSSPFYPLKLIRDTISDFLISDPSRKSEFYIHLADKRIAAVVVLFENGEKELANETLTKSLDYHEKAVEKMMEAKEAQDNVDGLYGKLNDSSAKHNEVIEMLEEEYNGNFSDTMKENILRAKELQNRVKAFSP